MGWRSERKERKGGNGKEKGRRKNKKRKASSEARRTKDRGRKARFIINDIV